MKVRTSAKIPEMRISVNFDEERGRQPRNGREPDIVYCHIKPTKNIRMAVIEAYLNKQMPFDNAILEAISKYFVVLVLGTVLTSQAFSII